jgi:hypothetical protein
MANCSSSGLRSLNRAWPSTWSSGEDRPARDGALSRVIMLHVAAMDLFVVPTIGFDLLYALVIVRLDRRELVWISVTTHPTAEWVARQITEAFPWNEAPHYMIRDRDRIYGAVVTRRMRAMGIRGKPLTQSWDTRRARIAARMALPASWSVKLRGQGVAGFTRRRNRPFSLQW